MNKRREKRRKTLLSPGDRFTGTYSESFGITLFRHKRRLSLQVQLTSASCCRVQGYIGSTGEVIGGAILYVISITGHVDIYEH